MHRRRYAARAAFAYNAREVARVHSVFRLAAESEAQRILADYRIPVTQETLSTSVDDACEIASRIGYPVAIKVQSPDISHKTEAKAVKLAIEDEPALRTAFSEVLANARAYRS